jgi:hypothetical protein
VPVVPEPEYCGYHFNIEHGVTAGFAGLLAIMVAMWLGYTELWLLGFDGKGGHFHDERTWYNGEGQSEALRDILPWLKSHPEYNIYQTNPNSVFDFFELNASVPLRGALKNI